MPLNEFCIASFPMWANVEFSCLPKMAFDLCPLSVQGPPAMPEPHLKKLNLIKSFAAPPPGPHHNSLAPQGKKSGYTPVLYACNWGDGDWKASWP